MNILLGITGSAAATLSVKMVEALQLAGHDVKAVLTRSAEYFVATKCLGVEVYTENSEWPETRYTKGDKICHIELRNWADLLLIAPITANTIGKLANGISDNLLTTIYTAWGDSGYSSYKHEDRKPVILAPAMNTSMWENSRVQHNFRSLLKNNTTAVLPVEKTLACGDTGVGALASIADIVKAVENSRTHRIVWDKHHGVYQDFTFNTTDDQVVVENSIQNICSVISTDRLPEYDPMSFSNSIRVKEFYENQRQICEIWLRQWERDHK